MKRTPLYDAQTAAGAEFMALAGYEIPRHWGDSAAEYQAIRQAAGILDFSYRGRLEFVGADRVTFLQSICSNDLKAASAGSGLESAFLTTMGKVVGYGRMYLTEAAILMDLDGEAQDKTMTYLDKYLRLSQTEMRDLRESYGHLSVQGPRAAEVLAVVAGAPVDALAPLQHQSREILGYQALIARVSHTGETGYDIFLAREGLAALWSELVKQAQAVGGRAVGFDAYNTTRLEAGIPLYGIDYNENHILVEANLASAVSYTKGCYVGQEIIARLHYRGHVAKRLALLRVAAATKPRLGDKVYRETKEVGQIASVTDSPLLGQPLAYAMVKYEPSQLGTELSIESGDLRLPAVVVAAPHGASCST